jgi:protein-disulfide isomerase
LKYSSLIVSAVMISFIAAGGSGAAERGGGVPGPSKEKIEKLIRDYILHNPEIILKSIQDHQTKQLAAQAAQAKKRLRDRLRELTRSPGSPVGGNPKGDVTVVEFFDYRCGYCRKSFPAVVELEKTDPNVRIVFKEFPILGPASLLAARAALAARLQGKYFALHKKMMGGEVEISETGIMEAASKLGLDTDKLREDMNSPAISEEIQKNNRLASEIGITGTPAFIVGEELIPGAIDIDGLRQLVLEARKGIPALRLNEIQ